MGGILQTAVWHRLLGISVLIFLLPADGSARGVSPYLPLNMAPAMERDIERVLILAGRSVLTRPLPAARVLDALPDACAVDPVVCRRVRRYLDRYMHKYGVSEASVEIASGDGDATVPNQHAMPYDSAWSASVLGYWQPSDYASLSLGGVAYDGDATPVGSMLSLGFEYAQVDIGYRDHWFSPFTDHAMFISTQAKTLPSITLSNYTPISSWGIRYEIFASEMEESERIVFEDGYTTGKPRLAGLHVSIEPASGWSLGASRMMQFGGGERGGDSFSDFMDALFRPREADNAGDDLATDEEFGNQVAAWTSEFIYPGPVPFSAYLEYAGEDTSYDGNYRLGNSALSLGIHFPRLWDRWELTYEASDWQNGWYVHHIYQDGLTNDGHVIGHWGADARVLNDGVGAQTHMVKVGWEPAFGGVFEFRGRSVRNEDYSTYDYEQGYDVGVSYTRPMGQFMATVGAIGGRDVFGESFGRVAAQLRWGDEWQGSGATPYSARAASNNDRADVFVEVGSTASRLTIHPGDTTPRVNKNTAATPHLGIGARREVSERSDLGVRIEYDRIDGATLLSVRALDYRYRFKNPLALGFFVGAARYDVATAAYGYQIGAGLEWRNLFRNMDAGIDVRYMDKMARDKLLPSDPDTFPRPDIFYDVYAATFTLRYRW